MLARLASLLPNRGLNMKVRATAPGFYGAYREIGDEFDVTNGETATWFEAVKGKKQDAKAEAATGGNGEGAKA